MANGANHFNADALGPLVRLLRLNMKPQTAMSKSKGRKLLPKSIFWFLCSMIWGVYITNDDLCLFAAVLSAQQPSNYIAKKGNKDVGTLMIAGVTWR